MVTIVRSTSLSSLLQASLVLFLEASLVLLLASLVKVKEEKHKSYDFLIDNIDSVMQSSNYESTLSELSKEQLITLFSLSNKQKKKLSTNSKDK